MVAVNDGGYRESVTDDTGILVEAEPGSIVKAIGTIPGDPSGYREACQARAAVFDISRFSRILKNIVNDCMRQQAHGRKIS